MAITITACGDSAQDKKDRAEKAAAQVAAQAASAACVVAKASYQKSFDQGDYWEAAQAIKGAHGCMNGATSYQLAAEAEILHYKKTINNRSESPGMRLFILERLDKAYPEEAKEFQKLKPELSEKAKREAHDEEIAAAKRSASRRKAEATRRKKEGVRIGMSQSEVIASSWGKPNHVNRTVTARGTHEQWVYGGGYLYFEDGVLTSIQN